MPFTLKDTSTMSSAEKASYIAELEAYVKNKNPKGKTPEVLVTLEEGHVQIRNLTSQAITFPAEVWPKLFSMAQPVLNFIEKHSHLVTNADASKNEIASAVLLHNRQEDLANNPNTVVRKPRAKNSEQPS